MNKQHLFKLAARNREMLQIGGEDVEVCAIDLDGRFEFNKTAKQSVSRRFAFIAKHCCPALLDADIDEIIANIDPIDLSRIAAKGMELSGLGAEQEAQAEKNSASGQS